jgi:hypothetical protein
MYTEWQRFVREYGHTLSGKDLLDNTDILCTLSSVHSMSVLSNKSLPLSVCPYFLTNLCHSVYGMSVLSNKSLPLSVHGMSVLSNKSLPLSVHGMENTDIR